MTTRLTSSYDDSRIRELLHAANDSARLFRTIFVTFMLLSFYVITIALSVSDELLFADGYLRAPILNINVRVSNFFIAAPWIVLFVHINVLIHSVFLVRKVDDYRRALPADAGESRRMEMQRLLFPIPLSHTAMGSALPLGFFCC